MSSSSCRHYSTGQAPTCNTKILCWTPDALSGRGHVRPVYSVNFKLLRYLAATHNVLRAITATRSRRNVLYFGMIWGAVNKLFPAMHASAGGASPGPQVDPECSTEVSKSVSA
jgi:hypothetical protein